MFFRSQRKKSPYKTFSIRLLASTIDTFILLIILSTLSLIIKNIFYTTKDLNCFYIQPTFTANIISMFSAKCFKVMILDKILGIIVCTIYIYYFWSRKYSTPGKMCFGMIIVNDNALFSQINKKQVLLRILGYYINCFTLGIAFLIIALNKKRKGLHDYIAGTIVIAKKDMHKHIS